MIDRITMLTDYIKSVWWCGLLSEDEKIFQELFDLKPEKVHTVNLGIGTWYFFECGDTQVSFIYGDKRWTVCAVGGNVLDIKSKRVGRLYEHMNGRLEES